LLRKSSSVLLLCQVQSDSTTATITCKRNYARASTGPARLTWVSTRATRRRAVFSARWIHVECKSIPTDRPAFVSEQVPDGLWQEQRRQARHERGDDSDNDDSDP
jgi:hypothetical protein